MKIRSVTAFAEVSYPPNIEERYFLDAVEALHAARAALTEAGLDVQTLRLATQPFPAVVTGAGDPERAVDLARDLEALASVHEIDYIALGPVRLGDAVACADVIPDILGQTERIFVSAEIATPAAGLSLSRIRRIADVIRRVSVLRADGFANLRLAALANVSPWSPFFPAAYHGGGTPCIAIATESADLAVAAISSASSLNEARAALIRSIETGAERIASAVRFAIEPFEVTFRGIDFSLAPYPSEMCSIGAALEGLGLPSLGSHGALFAAAFLTNALDQAHFLRTGFCGLMLPVLEDAVLAARAAEDQISTINLLMLSAICGTGLDTIPLPGDVSEDELTAILADVSALALRLDKPLTARLMPLPGKQAGDRTGFEFEYFANSRVMAPQGGMLSRLLAGDENIPLSSRPVRPI